MTTPEVIARFGQLCREDLPSPGTGNTPQRHRRIFTAGREDLSLAKLAEAHWDAVAILRESSREPAAAAKYAVWASEIPGRPMRFEGGRLSGTKEFCSGAGLVDRALISSGDLLLEIDLTAHPDRLKTDASGWQTEAFRATQTAALTFEDYPAAVVGEANWYVDRPGFWQGACGPAAAWAGGAAGLVDFAMTAKRSDAHTTAQLAAMHANVWATEAILAAAAAEFDREPAANAMVRALEVRHLVEQMCTDTLRRFARAMGPAPLAKNADVARRYAELDLFLRQCHAERDLEALGRALRPQA
ncbi:hypothetical protein Terro_0555 [Terriglobus roseus DSM 18391]|uniref:Acyl-CoA dehydrogenase n=1 Tax=Terriglobus roseus (strain DSM 18391 / NRRL B-41598 / KBS 63) TaxID=926566 RepID=I3ZCC7_TERRK|nr:hypothetical protein [Terriglobus roseus]AFL86895.1 hypothetical protein Terro_0555 [Terriglobus roseus DSM 18391]